MKTERDTKGLINLLIWCFSMFCAMSSAELIVKHYFDGNLIIEILITIVIYAILQVIIIWGRSLYYKTDFKTEMKCWPFDEDNK